MRQEAAAEANGSAARRRRAYLNGVAEGLAEGRAESQEAAYQRGLAEGKEVGSKEGRAESQEAAYQRGLAEGKEVGSKVGHEVAYNTGLARGREDQRAIFQGTHEALIKRACDLQAQLAESSKERFTATETASRFVVECKQRDNRIEALERDLENERQRSEELRRLLDHQDNPPAVHHRDKDPAPAAQSAQLTAAATRRPDSSVYLNRQHRY